MSSAMVRFLREFEYNVEATVDNKLTICKLFTIVPFIIESSMLFISMLVRDF